MVLSDGEQQQLVTSIADCKMDDHVLSLNWSNWRPCGRQEEADLLHRWYLSREEIDLVLITGASGVGKTTLSQSLHRIVQEDDGFLIRGTFSYSAEPYEAFKTAFTSFVRQLQERHDYDSLQHELKQAIASSGAEGFLIKDCLPILKTIMGDESSVSSGESSDHPILDGTSPPSRISATDRQHRFVSAMTKIVEAIGSVFPLVIVLDNLMWSDLGSLLMLESLCSNGKLNNVLMVATCRGDEVDYKAALSTRLRSMEDRGLKLMDMPLRPLTVEDTFDVIESLQTNNISEESSWRLAETVHNCTGGIPRLILEMLQIASSQGLDSTLLHIQVDYADLVDAKICRLPAVCREMLQVIACLGGRAVHESALVELMPGREHSELHGAIQMAEAEGILASGNQLGECTFFHGSIQEAIYTLIPEHVKKHIHYDIAQRLCSWFTVDQLEDNIFLVVDQYIHARDCICREDRGRIAELCLGAARKASFSAAFSSADAYVWHGIDILEERTRWRDHYDLTLALMNQAIELDYCNGNHEGVDKLHREIVQHSRRFIDKITSYATHISSLGARDNRRSGEAISECLKVLERLGEKLPRRFFLARTVAGLIRIKNILKKKSDDDLLRLPRLSDARIQAVTRILHILYLQVFLHKAELVPLVSMRMIDLTLQYGLSPISATSVGMFGIVLMVSDDFEGTNRCCELALKLMDAFKCKELTARTYASVYGFLNCYKNPIRESIRHLHDAYRLNILTGDVEMAVTCGSMSCGLSLRAGVQLSQIVLDYRGLIDSCILHNQQWILQLTQLSTQFALNMSCPTESNKPIDLSGELITEELFLKSLPKDNVSIQLSYFQFLKYFMAVYMADLPSSLEVERLGIPLRNTVKPHGVYTRCQQIFHEGILSCFLFSATNQKMKRRRNTLLSRAKKCVKMLRPFVVACPANYKNKLMLMEAEIDGLIGGMTSSTDVLLKYDEAARLARAEGFLHEHALSLEKAGHYVLKLNGQTEGTPAARHYFDQAIVAYEYYGAMGKVQQLKKVVSRLDEITQLMFNADAAFSSGLSLRAPKQVA